MAEKNLTVPCRLLAHKPCLRAYPVRLTAEQPDTEVPVEPDTEVPVVQEVSKESRVLPLEGNQMDAWAEEAQAVALKDLRVPLDIDLVTPSVGLAAATEDNLRQVVADAK